MLLNKSLFLLTALLVLLNGPSENLCQAVGPTSGAQWRLDEAWTDCSTECGPGVIARQAHCYKAENKRGLYAVSYKLLPDEQCDLARKPSTIERPCNLGSCQSKYRWMTNDWSVCSQLCGPKGVRRREIKCVFRGEAGDQPVSDLDANRYCLGNSKPHSSENCNRVDCSPKFEPDEWQDCQQDDPCQAGKQTRKINCKALLADGAMQDLNPAKCFIAGEKPKSTWRKCVIPEFSAQCKTQSAEIDEAPKKTVVQMAKEGDQITLQVGEEGYIIPSTRVTVKCPVKFFSSQNLVWMHENHGKLTYLGHSMERVHVDKDGNLLIENFKLADRGAWYCIAGTNNSTVMLMAQTPAEAYSDWLARQTLFNVSADSTDIMMNEDPKIYLEASESQLRWVEGEWSECNVECGKSGVQTRSVRCEELQSRVYHVLNDSVCESNHLPKPAVSRECQSSLECPHWKAVEVDKSQCTNECLSPGKGIYKARFECFLNDKKLSDLDCKDLPLPMAECDNPDCQLSWWTSQWSECSKSCGGIGVQSRTLRCVWQNNPEKSAKGLCFDLNLDPPSAVQTCQTGPCKTGCVDLSDVCKKNAEFCAMSTYRYHCCKSCRELYLESTRK